MQRLYDLVTVFSPHDVIIPTRIASRDVHGKSDAIFNSLVEIKERIVRIDFVFPLMSQGSAAMETAL
jgi:hypothetical protein